MATIRVSAALQSLFLEEHAVLRVSGTRRGTGRHLRTS
jgi:hypothetical protein